LQTLYKIYEYRGYIAKYHLREEGYWNLLGTAVE